MTLGSDVSQTFDPFGKYILLEKLAMGGMAEVYLAKNTGADGIGKLIAIKRILPQYSENPEFIDMFKDEAKIAVNLSHSNIVSIHEFGVEKSQFFLVMDYVEGRNLRQILNKMKKSGLSFSIEQVLYIIKEVAAGLDSAHRCLDRATGKPLMITHRDMSPQNVMISFEGEVKIVDFGIAKAETQIETTRAGTLKGKFGYMSPEQAEGQVVDLRTDIFSLGIVLWELLANDRLFVANNEINTLRKIRDCQIPSLRKINPNIPAELERICNKALARDRNLRYQTAAAFHRELNRFLNRQFPDFSPHDFSVFIKTLFASDILEHRKKIVDYSRADMANLTIPKTPAEPTNEVSDTPLQPMAAKKGPDSTKVTGQTATEQTDSTGTSSSPYFSNEDYREEDGGAQLPKPLPKAGPKPAPPPPPAPAPNTAEPVRARANAANEKKPDRKTETKADLKSEPKMEPKAEGFKKPLKPKVPAYSNEQDYRDLRIESQRPTRDGQASGNHESSYNNSVAGFPTGRPRPYTQTNATFVGQKQYYIRLAQQGLFGLVALMAVFAVGSYVYDSKTFMRNVVGFAVTIGVIERPNIRVNPNGTDTGTASHASIPKYKVTITSSPPAADVWINGTLHKDVTPTVVELDGDTEHVISLKRDQYLPILERRKFTRDGEKLFFKLSLARVAFIDIIVEGKGEIFVNDQRIATRGPILGYQIPADQIVYIKAYDPSTGAIAEEQVRLGESFRKSIKLYPKIIVPTTPTLATTPTPQPTRPRDPASRPGASGRRR